MKGHVRYILLGLLLVGLVVARTMPVFSSSTELGTAPHRLSTWSKYHDNRYGFSFGFPKAKLYVEPKEVVLLLAIPNPSFYKRSKIDEERFTVSVYDGTCPPLTGHKWTKYTNPNGVEMKYMPGYIEHAMGDKTFLIDTYDIIPPNNPSVCLRVELGVLLRGALDYDDDVLEREIRKAMREGRIPLFKMLETFELSN